MVNPKPYNRGTVTLHLWDPDTDETLDLPDYQNLSYSIPFNDLPVISFSYPINGKNGLDLAYRIQPMVWLEIDGIEPENHRFFIDQADMNMAFDQNEGTLHTYAGAGIIGRTRASLIYPDPGLSTGSVTGYRSNDRVIGGTAIPGHIAWSLVKGLWNEAEWRTDNAVLPLRLPGTLTHDASGYAWSSPLAVERVVTIGTSIWDFVKKMADQGYFHISTSSTSEVFVNGRHWSVKLLDTTNPTYYPDKSDEVIFRPGTHVKNERVAVNTRDAYSTVLGEGANRRYYESRDSTPENLYYRREVYISNTNLISDAEISNFFSREQQKRQSYAANSRTFEITPGSGNDYIPALDFDNGHKVSIDDQRYIWLGTTVNVGTVVAYTVSVGNTNRRIETVAIELVARLTSKEQDLQAQISNIQDGTTQVSHGPITVSATSGFTSTTSTSYTDTGNALFVDFTAPRSGRILVCLAADMWETVSGAECRTSFRISGADTLPADDNRCVKTSPGTALTLSLSSLISGLKPGGMSRVTVQHRGSGGPGVSNFDRRSVVVIPQD